MRKLARLSAIYVIGDIATRGAAFLLLPLYTRYLNPVDYGILAITTMLVALLTPIFSFGLTGAILQFYPQLTDQQSRTRFIGTLWSFLTAISLFGVVILSIAGPGIATFIFRQIPFDPYMRLALYTVLLQSTSTTILLTLFRAREQALRYVAVSVGSFLLTTGLTIWLVVFQMRGAVGSVQAQFGSALLVALLSVVLLAREVRPCLDQGLLRKALIYSTPLIPHLLAQWALNTSDRAILERYVSLADIGIYSLGYQFGMIYSMMIASLNNALTPTFSRAAVDASEMSILPRMITYYLVALAVIGMGIGLLSGDAVSLLLPEAYHGARAIIPWVTLGYFAMGLYLVLMSVLGVTGGKTTAVPFTTLIGAALNIGLNLLFVPHYGVVVAAITTLVGYMALAILMFVLAQRAQPLSYEYGRIVRLAITVTLLVALSLAGNGLHPALHMLVSLALIACLPLLLQFVGFWSASERAALIQWLQQVMAARTQIRSPSDV